MRNAHIIWGEGMTSGGSYPLHQVGHEYCQDLRLVYWRHPTASIWFSSWLRITFVWSYNLLARVLVFHKLSNFFQTPKADPSLQTSLSILSPKHRMIKLWALLLIRSASSSFSFPFSLESSWRAESIPCCVRRAIFLIFHGPKSVAYVIEFGGSRLIPEYEPQSSRKAHYHTRCQLLELRLIPTRIYQRPFNTSCPSEIQNHVTRNKHINWIINYAWTLGFNWFDPLGSTSNMDDDCFLLKLEQEQFTKFVLSLWTWTDSQHSFYKFRMKFVKVTFTPTWNFCSFAKSIGLCLRVKLLCSLPPRYKVN